VRYFAILDTDGPLFELTQDQRTEMLREVVSKNSSIVRYAVVRSGLPNEVRWRGMFWEVDIQSLFLIRLMMQLTKEYHED
jgi:hypothetical protein